jgi:hypothetical protein
LNSSRSRRRAHRVRQPTEISDAGAIALEELFVL